ncbi:MAG: TonB-dependent receptor [Proteobacteria bacterium]|nr:TonB-dependent receptor [Pseudomonadota bacterium]
MRRIRHPVAKSPLTLAIASVLYGGVTLVRAAPAEDASVLQEVVVTARKRAETLQEIPASIDVFSKDALQKLAITQFEDYATRTPSISFVSIGPGTQYFFMRGASDGSNPESTSNSIAGFFLNDVSLGYYGGIPDLHQYDLERIEVLNGPQGTLYGAGSMSGAVKLITAPPDPDRFSAGIDLDGSRFAGSNGSNHSEEAFVNFPLFDGRTAVRLSAFNVKQAGFINNLLKTRTWVNGVVSNNAEWAGRDYNTQTFKGGRIGVLQKLGENWKLSLTADYQVQNHNGAWDHDPRRYGDLNVARFGPEWGDNYNTVVQAKLEGDVGIGTLSYIAGYFKSKLDSVSEYSEYVQYVNKGGTTAEYVQGFACEHAGFVNCNDPYQYTTYRSDVRRNTHELRLQSSGEGRTHWIVGAYAERTKNTYSDFWHMPGINLDGEQATYYLDMYGGKAVVQPFSGEWYANDNRYDEHQNAIFGEVNYAINDRIRVTGGARWFEASSTGNGYGSYFYAPRVDEPYSGKWSKTTFRAGIEYKPLDQWLYYFNFAQGFREGVINTGTGTRPGIQGVTDPDTLNTYELGWKTEFRHGRLRWNGAAYYTKWKDFQTTVFDLSIAPTSFYANIGDSRIYGFESDIEMRPTERWILKLSASYNDSRIQTNHFQNPDYPVRAGERLPYIPYLKASASVRYEWPLFAHKAYVQFDESHTGSMWSNLSMSVRQMQPAYNLGSLRLGVDAADGHWSAEGYISNIANEHAVIFINPYLYDSRETTNAPRAVGLRLKYRFGGFGD